MTPTPKTIQIFLPGGDPSGHGARYVRADGGFRRRFTGSLQKAIQITSWSIDIVRSGFQQNRAHLQLMAREFALQVRPGLK